MSWWYTVEVSNLDVDGVGVGCCKRGPPSSRKWCRDEVRCKTCKAFNTSAGRRSGMAGQHIGMGHQGRMGNLLWMMP